MNKLFTLLTLLIIITGCSQSSPPTDPSVIVERGKQWEAALNAKDLDAMVALYESDAWMLPPNAPMSSGHEAVRAEFSAMIDAGLTGKLTSIKAVISGDIGYSIGNYTIMAGDTQVDSGKYMDTWHRGDDGQWRYSSDMFSSDLPVPEPAPKMMGGSMTHVMIMHEVEDGDKWLAAWTGENSRHKLFEENGAAHVHTVRSPSNPNLTGLMIAVKDLDTMQAMLKSEQGVAAATEDGVKMDTVQMLIEAKSAKAL